MGGNIRVTESKDQGWERRPSKDPEENSEVILNINKKHLKKSVS